MSEHADRADLLSGVKAIADYLNLPERRARHVISTTDMPVFRMGAIICARRAGLNEWLAQREASAAAKPGRDKPADGPPGDKPEEEKQ